MELARHELKNIKIVAIFSALQGTVHFLQLRLFDIWLPRFSSTITAVAERKLTFHKHPTKILDGNRRESQYLSYRLLLFRNVVDISK
jgi:hypothetical protein